MEKNISLFGMKKSWNDYSIPSPDSIGTGILYIIPTSRVKNCKHVSLTFLVQRDTPEGECQLETSYQSHVTRCLRKPINNLMNLRKINHVTLLDLKMIKIDFKIIYNMHYFFVTSEKLEIPVRIFTTSTKLNANVNMGLLNECPKGTS